MNTFTSPTTSFMQSDPGMSGMFLTLNSYVLDTVKIILLGSLMEAGRKLFEWLAERFTFRYAVTVEFNQADPTYPWIVQFLTHHQVWRRSKSFQIGAKTSRSRLGVTLSQKDKPLADYIPLYDIPQLFYWKGYFVEVRCDRGEDKFSVVDQPKGRIYLSIFTLDVSIVDMLVKEAKEIYLSASIANVVIHVADSEASLFHPVWNNVKRKARRPLSSVVLREGIMDSLLSDVREFLGAEAWYINAGIPYRRGYLLYGPPGTGKSSTIYALAGELGVDIYTLSLGSKFVDDSYLHRAVSGVPSGSIFLIEDIDCCFPSREDEEDEAVRLSRSVNDRDRYEGGVKQPKSQVTLSALLNTIDGVCSEDGVLFFATTNYMDRLDPALLRPGRVDYKLEYFLTSQDQASHLFRRFYPGNALTNSESSNPEKSIPPSDIELLSQKFGSGIPPNQFSTAELQGFLLLHKEHPQVAADGIDVWVQAELAAREERKERERERRERLMAIYRVDSVSREREDSGSDQGSASEDSGLVKIEVEEKTEEFNN